MLSAIIQYTLKSSLAVLSRFFFFSSRRRHTRWPRDWSSDVCSSDLSRGEVLVVVDQPNTIGALAVAVARDAGCEVAYLPGLAMRKAAQLMPGDAKTNARDAFVIATTAMKMPDTLRAVDRDSEVLASLKVLAGYDDDLARESTRAINRLRSLLLQIHPALERVFAGTRLTNRLSLDRLARYGGPTGLAGPG